MTWARCMLLLLKFSYLLAVIRAKYSTVVLHNDWLNCSCFSDLALVDAPVRKLVSKAVPLSVPIDNGTKSIDWWFVLLTTNDTGCSNCSTLCVPWADLVTWRDVPLVARTYVSGVTAVFWCRPLLTCWMSYYSVSGRLLLLLRTD